MSSYYFSDNELLEKIPLTYEAICDALIDGQDITKHVPEWERIEGSIKQNVTTGNISPIVQQLSSVVAHNMETFLKVSLALDKRKEQDLDHLSQAFGGLMSCGRRGTSGLRSCRKRDWRPPSPSPSNDGDSPSSSFSSHTSTETYAAPPSPISAFQDTNPTDHIRLWFLSHLAKPYPTPLEKESLASLTGIARNKIDSDMTNWRRRAGWTEIKDTWANGDKDEMKLLIEIVEKGKERRKAVREAVERMKAYLERREEERVGDWVYELTALAKGSKPKNSKATKNKNKKAKVELAERVENVDRPITPPPSAKHTPHSSISNTSASPLASKSAPVRIQSPQLSIRSASSSSISSFNTSPGGFQFDFNPYYSSPSSYPSTTITASSLNSGQKRSVSNDSTSTSEHPSTKQKLAPSPMTADEGIHDVAQWLPQATYTLMPIPSAAYTSDNTAAVWSTTQDLPCLPHMSGSSNVYTLPNQWEFRPSWQ